ncbi:MAG: bifunctional folylpolyglutamate synthase/dihydrofolate synthase [Deltaproteobacteria bacterium]|nr:bifunctional folylpolyglutamate synthase/dihydrofolate synthase [Deltaproteobacteria bacterium]
MIKNDAVDFLHTLSVRGIRPGLEAVSRFLASIGDPQLKVPSVLIGGTNGKGSVSAMIASVLHSAGYAVGLYTSPHLSDFRERICINGEPISADDLSALVSAFRSFVGEDITYFEFATALAFIYFSRRPVDVAVLEVGMGGRYDATNVAPAKLSVITTIGLDHQDYLGRTLAAIAAEKAGIIKGGAVVISGVRRNPARGIIENTALERHARLYQRGRDFRVGRHEDGSFTYRGSTSCYGRIVSGLRGLHQVDNAGLAITAIEALKRTGFPVSEKSLREGLSKVCWPGRFEVLSDRPLIIADGAHNPAGIEALCRSLIEYYPGKRIIFIAGVLRDKGYRTMVRRLCRTAARLIFTRPPEPRGLDPAVLASVAAERHRWIDVEYDCQDALRLACKEAADGDLICITGSLYLVGALRASFPLFFCN